MRYPIRLVCLLLASLSWSMTACASDSGLSEQDLEQATETLLPQFLAIHDQRIAQADELTARAEALLAGLGMDQEPELLLTHETDADAGCLAGHWVYLTQGLLLYIETIDELAAALALGATACAHTAGLWRNRAAAEPDPINADNQLFHRYRDFRLARNAAFYNQLVAIGCGEQRDCADQARSLTEQAGHSSAALDALSARVRETWPDAALFARFDLTPLPAADDSAEQNGREADNEADNEEGGDNGDNHAESNGDAYRDGETAADSQDEPAEASIELLNNPFRQDAEAYRHLRDAGREYFDGDLLSAYRSIDAARSIIGNLWPVRIAQMRTDLANAHGYYAERDKGVLEEDGYKVAEHDYVRGVSMMLHRLYAAGVPHLRASLDVVPRVSTYFYIGRFYRLTREFDIARPYLETALSGGEIHHEYELIRRELERIDG